jgi:NAD(P)H-dependent FMN reductase
MITIIGLSGSLRSGSYNSAVLRAAASVMPADSTLQIESIAGIPLYNADDEVAHGVPPAVARLKDAIIHADGLLLVSPEYNNSIPGVAKNAIDWLSRPPSDVPRIFRGRPVALAGASPGGFGTILSQNAWLGVFRTLGVDLWAGGRLLVSHAATVIGVDGSITDEATRAAVQKFVSGFVAHVRQHSPVRRDAAASRDAP